MWRRTKQFFVLAMALMTIVGGTGCEDWLSANGLPSDATGISAPASKLDALLKVRFSVLPRPQLKTTTVPVDDGSNRLSIGTAAK